MIHPALHRRSLPSIVALFFLTAIGCESALPGQRVGDLAPDIFGQSADDKPIRLGDFKGKVVLVDFWASWCGPCRMTFPEQREKVQRTYANRPFAVLGVAQEDPRAVGEFLQQNNLPWANIADDNQRISKEWGINALPSYILIDHQGVIRGRWTGASQMERIWEMVDILVRDAEKK